MCGSGAVPLHGSCLALPAWWGHVDSCFRMVWGWYFCPSDLLYNVDEFFGFWGHVQSLAHSLCEAQVMAWWLSATCSLAVFLAGS